jgi:hypothetical protein
MLSGGGVAYQSKTQSITASIAMEAEFIADVSATKKVAKYSVPLLLYQLGSPQTTTATSLFKDNKSTLKMVNTDCPPPLKVPDISKFSILQSKIGRNLVQLTEKTNQSEAS